MSKNEEEEYFILRLPGDTAAEVHRAISSKKLKDRLKINMCGFALPPIPLPLPLLPLHAALLHPPPTA
jgi:hypothetical protein